MNVDELREQIPVVVSPLKKSFGQMAGYVLITNVHIHMASRRFS